MDRGGLQRRKPSLGKIEEQRRRALESALPDVRTVLDAALGDPDRHVELVNAVAPLVALVVAEIAVLDRQTDAADRAVIRQYGAMIATVLGLNDEPWRAVTLWRDAATAALAQFGVAWSAHLERAAKDSESKHRHRKLVELEQISAALSLTRPRIASIFGTEKCSLKPIRLKDPTFSTSEQRLIRELHKRTGWTTRRIKDLALTLTPDAFCNKLWPIESQILPEDRIAGRRVAHSSDVQTSRWVHNTTKKPGPKRSGDTLTAQIGAVAAWRGVSKDSIKRLRNKRTNELLASAGEWDPTVPMTPDCSSENLTFPTAQGVPMHPNSCPDAPEFPHSEKVTFSASFFDETDTPTRTVKGVLITDLILVDIVDEGRVTGRRKRYEYPDRALVEAWHLAEKGEPLSADKRKKWAQRNRWLGTVETARRWRDEQQRRAQEDTEEQRLSQAA